MKPMNRFATAATAAAFAATALLVPTAAQAAPILATTAASSTCVVTGGELGWGVKEGFRSYISGTIANGSWEVADGASYETPLFGWTNPTGEIDAVTGEGSVSFAGSIHFTGHDGVLNLQIANPTVVLNGDGTAKLLMDTKSNNAQGELVVDDEWAKKLGIESKKAVEILKNVQRVLAIELFAAGQAAGLIGEAKLAPATRAVYDVLRAEVPQVERDILMYEQMQKCERIVIENRLISAVEAITGELN